MPSVCFQKQVSSCNFLSLPRRCLQIVSLYMVPHHYCRMLQRMVSFSKITRVSSFLNLKQRIALRILLMLMALDLKSSFHKACSYRIIVVLMRMLMKVGASKMDSLAHRQNKCLYEIYFIQHGSEVNMQNINLATREFCEDISLGPTALRIYLHKTPSPPGLYFAYRPLNHAI